MMQRAHQLSFRGSTPTSTSHQKGHPVIGTTVEYNPKNPRWFVAWRSKTLPASSWSECLVSSLMLSSSRKGNRKPLVFQDRWTCENALLYLVVVGHAAYPQLENKTLHEKNTKNEN